MSYKEPAALSAVSVVYAVRSSDTTEQNLSVSDLLWPLLLTAIMVTLFGIVAGLAALASYLWLKSSFGTAGAFLAGGVLGVVAKVGFVLFFY